MFTQPTIADFQAYFFRDFPYGSDFNTVQDQDIQNALSDAAIIINPGLFGDQSTFQTCFLLLAAHYMVMSLRASSQGIAGQFAWLQASKAVGNVNEAFTIPQQVLDHPVYAMLSKTNYGAKYLSIILPLSVGAMFTVRGHTKS